jgi:hypothetical protein
VGWNRSNRLTVTDNTSTNVIGEQIALTEILNPRRGNSGTWSGAGDSVTGLILSPGGSSWQLRADEFDSSLVRTDANAGTFMIHQDGVATRLVIRNDGNVGIGTTNPQARLDVQGGNVRIGAYTLPSTDGTNGQTLVTNGTGAVNWQSAGKPTISQEYVAVIDNKVSGQICTDMGDKDACFLVSQEIQFFDNTQPGVHYHDIGSCWVQRYTTPGNGWSVCARYNSFYWDNKGRVACGARCLKW